MQESSRSEESGTNPVARSAAEVSQLSAMIHRIVCKNPKTIAVSAIKSVLRRCNTRSERADPDESNQYNRHNRIKRPVYTFSDQRTEDISHLKTWIPIFRKEGFHTCDKYLFMT